MYSTVQGDKVNIKVWNQHVPMDSNVYDQARMMTQLDFVKGVAIMPDAHLGIGATVGSVIAARGAICPASVGVDIGCGMSAVRTSLTANDLPDNLLPLRRKIERMVPVGFKQHRPERLGHGHHRNTPALLDSKWAVLGKGFEQIMQRHPDLDKRRKNLPRDAYEQIATLGGGNHFLEVCLDESDNLWVMLHSGSRGVGNVIGMYFIHLAQQDMEGHLGKLPDKDLAYLREGSQHYDDYMMAVEWAQEYARVNRQAMMVLAMQALEAILPPFTLEDEAINCHHNYVSREEHNGTELLITRKGAIKATAGLLGIIPGSMGAKSYIVRGLGNSDSYHSCSHGAGRLMSRGQARKKITVAEHVQATDGVECRKDKGVLDESPAAYKDIDAVMESQRDLVEPVHTLKQILCVKG